MPSQCHYDTSGGVGCNKIYPWPMATNRGCHLNQDEVLDPRLGHTILQYRIYMICLRIVVGKQQRLDEIGGRFNIFH